MRYWLFKNDKVAGPYEPRELVALPSYSPDWLVCPDGRSGAEAGDWRRADAALESRPAPEPLAETARQDSGALGDLRGKCALLENAVVRMQAQLRRGDAELSGLREGLKERARRLDELAAKHGAIERSLIALAALSNEVDRSVSAEESLESALEAQEKFLAAIGRELAELSRTAAQPPAPPPAPAATGRRAFQSAKGRLAAGIGAAALLAMVVFMAGRPGRKTPAARDESGAVLAALSGEVRLRARGEARPVPAANGAAVRFGDELETAPRSSAHVVFPDGDAILLKENSGLTLEGTRDQKVLSIPIGEFLIGLKRSLRPEESFEVRTPSAVAAVRGTLFWGLSAPDGSTTYASFGHSITVTAQGKTVELKAGQTLKIDLGRPPGEPAASAVGPQYLDTFSLGGSLEGLEKLVDLPKSR